MFSPADHAVLRRAYARYVTFLSGADNTALEQAFAAVPRESYLGAGPWAVLAWGGDYRETPDSDPAWLYHDCLVAIVRERRLNNGQPSGHAKWISAVAPQRGEHVVHIGAGVGYYSAILAHMVGPQGRVTAIEYDPELASRATANLAEIAQVRVLQGDGACIPFAPADVIYVNAGATHPPDAWLDGLTEGGRLILPLTTATNFGATFSAARPTGATFRFTRRGDGFDADFVSYAAFIPCEGLRDEASERALAAAFEKGGFHDVKRLRRDENVADEDCWMKTARFSLTYR